MSKKQREEPIMGAWEYDSTGRKFRRFGNSIEYAPTIQTTYGTVYVDDLEAHNKRIKEQEEQRRKEQQAQAVKIEPKGLCPFKVSRNDIHTHCVRDCIFFDDVDCILARTDTKPTKDTKDKYCPMIARPCFADCALYNSGCALTCIVKGLKPEKE